MSLEKEKFRRYELEESLHEIKYGRPISVRLNETERKWLEEIKEDLNIKSDSKALKYSALIGKNVLQSLLSRKILQYLFKNDRQKLDDFKNY